MFKVLVLSLVLGFGLLSGVDAYNKEPDTEVLLPPKLLSDIRTVLDCPHGMTATVRGKDIVMASCINK